MFKWVTFTVAVVLLIFISFKQMQRTHRLNYVSSGLQVDEVLYAHEDSYGLGPGAAEVGLVMFELPEDVAKKIQLNGVRFLNELPHESRVGNSHHGIFQNWQSSPIKADPKWSSTDSVDRNTSFSLEPKISNYLGNYFGYSIDEDIEKEVNRVVASPGSFFSYGRHGVLIVSPETRRVFFAYNG